MCLTTRSLQIANLSFQTEKNKPGHGLSTLICPAITALHVEGIIRYINNFA